MVSRHRRVRWAGELACAWSAGCLPAPPAAAATPVAADSHLQAAQRQSRADPALQAAVRRACARSSAPASAALAVRALQQAEAEHQHERAQPRPDPARLLHTVVLRSCLAYHATRLQAGASYPVWLHTRLAIESVRPAGTGFEAQARATTADGAAVVSRVTFSRGLHHACFAQSDPSGLAGCTLVDTHPHGDRGNGWAEAHEGPLVATYAGSVGPGVVALPAVATRDFPVFASFGPWLVPLARSDAPSLPGTPGSPARNPAPIASAKPSR